MGKKSFLIVTDGSYSHASSRIRAINYIHLLKNRYESKITWIPRVADIDRSGVAGKIKYFFLKRYYFLKLSYQLIFFKWDLLFVQRFFMCGFFLYILRRKKIKLIYDFDDAIYLPQDSGKGNDEKTKKMVHAADRVIVSSPTLLKFCNENGVITNVDLIVTPVDTEKITPVDTRNKNRKGNLLTIGWIGSPWTSKYLVTISDSLRQLSEVVNLRLLAIGIPDDFKITGVKVDRIQWSVENEIHYLREMDVGIMPLPADEWAKAKGGYKLFLYMAAGIPVIASSVGFNNQIIRHGMNGYLCDKQEDWFDYLNELYNDASLRVMMGTEGRKDAENKYSYRINSQKLYSVIDELI